MASTDNHGGHVSALAFFTIAEEKLKEYEARVLDSLERTKEGTLKTGQCLYYGFAKCGNTMVCREGYKTAMDFFPHLAEVKENLDQDIAGKYLIITMLFDTAGIPIQGLLSSSVIGLLEYLFFKDLSVAVIYYFSNKQVYYVHLSP